MNMQENESFSLFSNWNTYSSISYGLHGYRASSDHKLEFRKNYLSRLVSRPSSSSNLNSPSIIYQNPSVSMSHPHYFSFPLHLLQQNPFLCIPLLLQFFSSFNISPTHSNLLAHQIIFLVVNYTTRHSHYIAPFRIVAHIDHIQNFWVNQPFPIVDDQTSTRRGATVSGIERLKKKRKFVNLGDDELGNCVVCHEELCSSSDNKEVIKMHCNHLFHESCIVQWLKKSDSCPLCRSPATKLSKPTTSSC